MTQSYNSIQVQKCYEVDHRVTETRVCLDSLNEGPRILTRQSFSNARLLPHGRVPQQRNAVNVSISISALLPPPSSYSLNLCHVMVSSNSLAIEQLQLSLSVLFTAGTQDPDSSSSSIGLKANV
jgi:hypothetical protein